MGLHSAHLAAAHGLGVPRMAAKGGPEDGSAQGNAGGREVRCFARLLCVAGLSWLLGFQRFKCWASNLVTRLLCCRRMNRIKAAGAFKAWRQHTAALTEARLAAEQMAAVGNAALVQQCFAGWAGYLARRGEQQAAVMSLVQRRAVWLMANVMQAWRSFVEHSTARQQQMRRVCCKLARVRLQQAFAAWRQRAAEQQACAVSYQVVEKKMQVWLGLL